MRRAGPGDAQIVRSLTREVYAKWIPSIGREPLPMAADYDIAVRAHWIDLLERDGEVLALIEMMPRADHLWIQNIAVSAVHQRGGIGEALLQHADETARRCGLPEVRLNTNAAFESNVVFYAKRGFRETLRETLPDGGTAVYFARAVS